MNQQPRPEAPLRKQVLRYVVLQGMDLMWVHTLTTKYVAGSKLPQGSPRVSGFLGMDPPANKNKKECIYE
jgi:hypothetical protein